jgi:hypothetical protein
MAARPLPQTEAFRAAPIASSERLPLPIGGEGWGEGATCDVGRDGYSNFPPTLALPLAGGGKRHVPAFRTIIEVSA